MIRPILYSSLILLVFAAYSCRKPDKHPPEPVIEYNSHDAVSSDTLLLRINFEDGDGDIGFFESDTTKNLFLTYIQVKNGVATEIQLPDPFTYKVPDIQPTGKNKFVKGVMTIIIYPLYYFPGADFDFIRYKVQLQDKAGNLSNVVETPDITVK